MKKLYFLLFFAFSFIANAQIVNIPDINFKNYLKNNISINTNQDSEIQITEALSFNGTINCEGLSIFDLTGIEAFVNLQFLNCSDNQLTNLNVSQNINLTDLYCENNLLTSLILPQNNNLYNLICDGNQLTNLDIGQNSNLILIDCKNNQLSSLNITQGSALQQLNCSANQVTSIDVSQNLNLTHLTCDNNLITNLDVSQNVALYSLVCSSNFISNLDVSQNITLHELYINDNEINSLNVQQNPSLIFLNCGYNQLTSINVSQNPALIYLICNGNQLSSLDVSQNSNLYYLQSISCDLQSLFIKNGNLISWTTLDFSNNPNLQFICADDEDVDLVQQKINTYGYGSTCHVNSYCSFTPNGTFYDITGNTKFDFNNNGCDVVDINYPNLKISITDGTNSGTMIADTTGDYYIPVQAGNYTITPNLENPTYFNISPASFTVDFPTQASPFTQDFCVTANGVHSDVEILVMPTNPARPGFDADYKIVYKNKGNQIENGTVSLTFDDTVLDYVTSNPVYNSNATNSFTWNYTNLQPFETREIIISFNVNSPMESPAVNIDDVLDYTTTITTANTEETPDDNTFELNQTVVGSFDPNDKTCLEGETVDVATVGKYVHYVIRFENTGTYPAQNIVVKDMIDTSKFDVSTLVPLDGSHEFYTRIKDNKVEFIFENINLDFNDATNDGYVSFKIKTLPTLTVGETFSNDANIYFDYNFPITTNEYVTTIQNVLSNQDFVFENEFVLYPNPVKEVLNISSKNQTEISSIEIYNIVGQVVIAIPNTTKTIDVSNLETGTYFIKVNSETGTTTTKFVKE